ncbi:MAG TPA: hypothetical protein VMM78_12270, partial [Thermomicrobiales bacterium]|nr:hypothetical protein [Thermomicrobiales bacterium]
VDLAAAVAHGDAPAERSPHRLTPTSGWLSRACCGQDTADAASRINQRRHGASSELSGEQIA